MGACGSKLPRTLPWPDAQGGSSAEDAMKRLASGSAGADKFFEPFALLDSVISGAVAPLRGRYVLDLWKSGGRIQRRQDLPPHAFWKPEELVQACKELREIYKLAENGEEDWNSEIGTSRMGVRSLWGFLFIAISYRWLGADHPDPDGFHLDKIGRMLDLYLNPSKCYSTAPLSFVYVRLLQYGSSMGFKGENAPKDIDCAIFWDFGSLFQGPRSSEESVLFKAGLKASNMWYGNQCTTVWKQPSLPAGFAGVTYESSGWCFIESTMASLLTHELGYLDISSYKGGYYLPLAFASGATAECSHGRRPPLLTNDVAHILASEKSFMASSDTLAVAELYRDFFDSVAPQVTELRMPVPEWTEQQLQELCGVLPRFTNLRVLDMVGSDPFLQQCKKTKKKMPQHMAQAIKRAVGPRVVLRGL